MDELFDNDFLLIIEGVGSDLKFYCSIYFRFSTDIDECEITSLNKCNSSTRCFNRPGGYHCEPCDGNVSVLCVCLLTDIEVTQLIFSGCTDRL